MWKRLTKAKATICVKDRIDPSEGQVSPSDDGFHLGTPQIGDFEWWYFDITDPGSDCTLKIVAHLGTDPLRRRFYPQLVVSIRTPTQRRKLIRRYSLEDFSASVEFCDVRLSGEFRAYVDSPNRDLPPFVGPVPMRGFHSPVLHRALAYVA